MANEITSANVAQAIVKLVAARALPALVGNLVMGSLVNRDYEPTLAQAGDTINVPIPPVMTANNIAEGGTVQNQNPSLGNAQIVLNSHVEATFTIPDVVKVLAAPDLVEVYMRPAINAIAEKIETDLLSLYPLLTANAPVGSGGTALTEATIDAAETALFVAKVPQSAQKYLVVSPTAYSQLRQLPRFTEQQTAGSGEPILTGTLGRIKDFTVVRSQYVPTVSGTTYNVAFARDAFGLVIRRLPQPLPGTGAVAEYVEQGNFGLRVIMSYQPNTLSQQFTVDVLYGVGVLRNNFAVAVRN
jgi:N4-gp56 family major capsid protein